jgi:hypothetical protein
MEYSDIKGIISHLSILDLSILAGDLSESLDDVVLNEANPNFEGRNTSEDFDLWVRGCSNVELFGLLHNVLNQLEIKIRDSRTS